MGLGEKLTFAFEFFVIFGWYGLWIGFVCPPLGALYFVVIAICGGFMLFASVVPMGLICNILAAAVVVCLVGRLIACFIQSRNGEPKPVTILKSIKNIFIVTFLQFLLVNLAMMRIFQQGFELTGIAKLFRMYGEWFDTIDASDTTILGVWFAVSAVLVVADYIIVSILHAIARPKSKAKQ